MCSHTCNATLFNKFILKAHCLRPLRKTTRCLSMKCMKYMCVVILSYCSGGFSAKNPVPTLVLALDFFQFTSLGFAVSPAISFLRSCLCMMALPLVPVLQLLWEWLGPGDISLGGCTALPGRKSLLLLVFLPQPGSHYTLTACFFS